MASVLCITGMHRSGTSLAASWLESCGLAIHNGYLIKPSTGNIRGHFEDKDFVNLQSKAILSYYPISRGWKVFGGRSLKFSNDSLTRANKLVENRNSMVEIWGWKDPRSVLFLEQWKEIIPQLKVILIWRSCSDVVYSLVKRSVRANDDVYLINPIESIKLWIHYNSKLGSYKQSYPNDTLLFYIHTIINQNQYVLDLINEKFHLDLTYKPIDEIYDPKLFHNKQRIFENILNAYPACSSLRDVLRDQSDGFDETVDR